MMNKIFKMILLGAVPFLFSCGNRLEEYIPGTYVYSATGEYSIAHDTLLISAQPNGIYQILRSSGWQKIRDGKLLAPEYDSAYWLALFDKQKGILQEIDRGKILAFDPKAGTLNLGKRSYRKLKDSGND